MAWITISIFTFQISISANMRKMKECLFLVCCLQDFSAFLLQFVPSALFVM